MVAAATARRARMKHLEWGFAEFEMRHFLIGWMILACCGWVLAGEEADPRGEPVRTYSSQESFEDVIDNLKTAIIDRGLLVSGTLHVSEMLNRTAADLGFAQRFVKAESVEFCSALMSHKMSRAAPENIAICPFTIAVFVTAEDPQRVRLAYRRPMLAGDAGEVSREIEALLDGIVQDAL